MAEQKQQVLTPEMAEMMRIFAQTVMQGDPDEAKEKEELKKRQKAMKASMVESIGKSDLLKQAMRDNCPHQKENGRPSTGGQVFGDGNVGIICLQCTRVWKVPATPEQRRMIDSGDVSLAEIKPPDSKYIVH